MQSVQLLVTFLKKNTSTTKMSSVVLRNATLISCIILDAWAPIYKLWIASGESYFKNVSFICHDGNCILIA